MLPGRQTGGVFHAQGVRRPLKVGGRERATIATSIRSGLSDASVGDFLRRDRRFGAGAFVASRSHSLVDRLDTFGANGRARLARRSDRHRCDESNRLDRPGAATTRTVRPGDSLSPSRRGRAAPNYQNSHGKVGAAARRGVLQLASAPNERILRRRFESALHRGSFELATADLSLSLPDATKIADRRGRVETDGKRLSRGDAKKSYRRACDPTLPPPHH